MTQASTGTDGGVRSVARAFDLLNGFDAEHPVRTLRELVELSGLPKSTVVRLLGTLTSQGLVANRGDSTTYSVGPAFLRWVALADAMWEVGAEARQLMTDLRDRCGETVNIYIRQDLHRVSIAQVEGTTTVRSVVQVGERYPLVAGAAGRILLGGCPDEVLDTLAEQEGATDLRNGAAGAREVGYAITHGDRELGASAVAAPIVSADGRVLAALSISGPTSRFTADRVARYVDAVTDTARQISAVGLGTVEAFL
ncbi:IclR family transcriptional regulator [Rhodococcus sp. Z13]|uniref:IclR family transcriptional regulator n=1 Tax=Rhodococcus sacchari TaxID=2962047 RepID=A0ACD4DE13_9NOCA|nr:IclR family transcriptional regulator [Rhodococcus sp. Z13]UYP17923.1 IclR family transcriptional regulator [Rhodococcus sp. Z13]